MHLFGQWIRRLFLLNLFFLGVMSLFRVATLAIYAQPASWQSDLMKAFWMGFRFDSVVIGYLIVIPTLGLIAALHSRRKWGFHWFARGIKPYYVTVFALVALILAVDIKYYSYFQDHINIVVFGFFEDDTMALISTFWRNYPVIWYFAFAALGIWLIAKAVSRILVTEPLIQQPEKLPAWTMSLVSFILFCCVLLLCRGSFGLFPLGQTDSVISKDPFINHLVSNGVHGLYRAVKLRRLENSRWDQNIQNFGYSDIRQAFADFYQAPLDQVPASPLEMLRRQTPPNAWAEKTKPHVILLMMESFGTYWLKYQSADFNLLADFEKHIQEDFFLKNFLPSASSTTGSLSSILISSPQRPVGGFLTESQYLQVPFRSSPARVYARAGYETRFIYGGNPGWRDMNKFARYQGFEHVEGDVDIKTKLGEFKEVHDWGIYDEDLFRYVLTILKEAQKPQMIVVMTTTNHPPYQVPSTFKPPVQKIPDELAGRLNADRKLAEARFRTYLYSSQELARFMDAVKNSDLSSRTLVAATGDHNFFLVPFADDQLLQRSSVPLYMYAPRELKLQLSPATFGSHMDIFPTLYSLSLSEAEFHGLGVNLFDPSSPKYALHDSQVILGPAGGVQLQGKSEPVYYTWAGDSYEKLTPAEANEERRTMALRYRSLMALMDYYLHTERQQKRDR
jgi:phosphoglycerol transferase MdoB-like AlkP superfamily enzyme